MIRQSAFPPRFSQRPKQPLSTHPGLRLTLYLFRFLLRPPLSPAPVRICFKSGFVFSIKRLKGQFPRSACCSVQRRKKPQEKTLSLKRRRKFENVELQAFVIIKHSYKFEKYMHFSPNVKLNHRRSDWWLIKTNSTSRHI